MSSSAKNFFAGVVKALDRSGISLISEFSETRHIAH